MTLVHRLVLAAAMVVSGGVHAYLYVHGYRHIPTVGTGFLLALTRRRPRSADFGR